MFQVSGTKDEKTESFQILSKTVMLEKKKTVDNHAGTFANTVFGSRCW